MAERNSIFRYFTGVQPPPPKKQKTSEELKEKSRKYEQTRTRNFDKKWLQEFNWLSFKEDEEKMYCSVCVACRATTNSFKIDTLKKHAKSTSHQNSLRIQTAKKQAPGQSQSDQTLISLKPGSHTPDKLGLFAKT